MMREREVASLALALLQADSFQTLLSVASPFVVERHLLLGISTVDLFCWKKIPELTSLIHNVDIPNCINQKVVYQVLDDETIYAGVFFHTTNGKQLLVVLLMNSSQDWSYHDIRLFTADDAPMWFPDIQTAKKKYSLNIVKNNPLLMDQEEAAYWSKYQERIDPKSEVSRAI
jgi:hypothetical protein